MTVFFISKAKRVLTSFSLRLVNRLTLHENKFSGSIPQELASLMDLEYLDLSDNDFGGNLGR